MFADDYLSRPEATGREALPAASRAKPRIVADSGSDQQEPQEDGDQPDETDLTVTQPGDPGHRGAPLCGHQERTEPLENQDQARRQRERLSHARARESGFAGAAGRGGAGAATEEPEKVR